MSINTATISGYLGGDPELRQTASGASLKVDDLDFASTRQEAAPAPYDEVPADVYDADIPF